MGRNDFISDMIELSISELGKMYNYVCPSNSKLLDTDVALYVMSLQSSIVAELLIKKLLLKYAGRYKKTHYSLDLLDTLTHKVYGKVHPSISKKLNQIRKKHYGCLSVDHSVLRYEPLDVDGVPNEDAWDAFFTDLITIAREMGVN